MDLKGKFTHIFFDADDTLWENEKFFRDAEVKFAELLCDHTSPEGVQEMLWHKQEENIPLFGYGSKTYMIGMTDAAVELCGGHMTDKIYHEAGEWAVSQLQQHRWDCPQPKGNAPHPATVLTTL